ncbi:hypothetical protein GFJ95_00630 [Flavobacterium sp. LMO9]|nr:hypothetical protein [Flavobacterium sp. LMO9]MQP61450.1 hypothetical protein [Flavobacterium sp. LMO6]
MTISISIIWDKIKNFFSLF